MSTKASAVIQDLTYTEKQLGLGVTISYTNGGTAGSEVVTVSGHAISVAIASGASTAAQIKTAIEANYEADLLVSVTVSGTGTNAQVSCKNATLSGGTAGVKASKRIGPLLYTAVTAGTGGNSIRIKYQAGEALAVGVSSSDITVTVVAGVTRAVAVMNAVNADVSAAALVEVTRPGFNDVVLVSHAAAFTALTGGLAAAAASVVVQDLTFSGDATGTSKNGSTISYTTGATAGAEVVSVSGSDVTVRIENGVSTATQIKTAFDASTAANGSHASGTVTMADYTKGHLTAATGTITYGTPDVYAAAVKATGTVEVVDYTKLAEATAVASGSITFGTPDAHDTIVVTGPAGGPYTFEMVALDPEANQFIDIDSLRLLLNQIDGIDALVNSGDIDITVETAGTGPNSWTITGTGTWSALSITFSGGQDHATLAVDGTTLVEGTDFDAETSNTVTADNIVAALPETVDGLNTSGSIALTAATAGTAGNAIALATSDAVNLTISGAYLTGGTAEVAASTLTFHDTTDHVFTCVAAAPGANEFSSISELNTLLDNLSTVGASQDGTDITITAAAAGTAANAYTLVKTGAGLTLSGATLAGGIDALEITVGTITLTESTDFSCATSNAASATSLASAIDGLSNISAAAESGVVTVTSDLFGTAGNSVALATSAAAAATVSGSTLAGGTAAWACTVSGTGGTAQKTVNAQVTSGAVGDGVDAYAKDQSVTALTSSFVAFHWSFPSALVTLVNDETSGTKQVLVSLDGTNTHYTLNFGESLVLNGADRRLYGVWLKYGTGAPAYRLMVI